MLKPLLFHLPLPLIVVSFLLSLGLEIPAFPMHITLQWDANLEPDVVSYLIYYKTDSSGPPYDGTGADEGPSPIEMSVDQDENPDPDIVEFTLHGLADDEAHFFAVTACNTERLESDFSNEASCSNGVDANDESGSPSGASLDPASGGGGTGCFIETTL